MEEVQVEAVINLEDDLNLVLLGVPITSMASQVRRNMNVNISSEMKKSTLLSQIKLIQRKRRIKALQPWQQIKMTMYSSLENTTILMLLVMIVHGLLTWVLFSTLAHMEDFLNLSKW